MQCSTRHQALTPAQLEVLERIKQKQTENPKGRKSVKVAGAEAAREIESDNETATHYDRSTSTNASLIGSSQKRRRKPLIAEQIEDPESSFAVKGSAPTVRGRRTTLRVDASLVSWSAGFVTKVSYRWRFFSCTKECS